MEKQIRAAVGSCRIYIRNKYKVDINPVVRLDLTGRAAGQARFDPDQDNPYTLRVNIAAGVEHLVRDTVPHEMAHLLEAALGSRMSHGRAWEHYCKELGGNGLMYHTLDLKPARKTRMFRYMVGQEVYDLTTKRHNRIQNKGVRYEYPDGTVVGIEHFIKELE